ncbi:MAG: RnfABCDGE type electron transport complex subunit D [Clostridia bacterium]|nr:RnfABCDGE type electron transport complex subunit D [Clostridia bacterium]
MTENVPINVDLQERERTLDWLTALSPILLIAICYYRWQAVGLVLTATAGYLAVTALLQWAGVTSCRTAPALVTGMLVAFCLPSTSPLWTAALGGGVAAAVATLPVLLYGWRPTWVISRPLLQPALVGYLVVRLLFPACVSAFHLPKQWDVVDGVAGATPLVALGDPSAVESPLRLLFGVHAGAVGEGCVPVILLAALYLLLRRRLRLIAPAVMLATVSLLSLLIWDMPLYGVLVGGTVLGALLLADRAFAPAAYGPQAVSGLLVGVIVALSRLYWGMDGTAVAVLVAGALSPVYAPALHWSGVGVRWFWKHFKRFCVWFWHRALVPFARLVARGAVWFWHHALVPFARLVWRGIRRLWALLRTKCAKMIKTKK